MQILITGATGFIGSAISQRLMAEGHGITVATRSAQRARDALGEVTTTSYETDDLVPAVERSDGVINLAGASIFGKRWSEPYKQALVESRLSVTASVVDAIERAARRPRVLVSASASGYYGDRGAERLTEDAPPGNDFLARLCIEWERASQRATELDVRVVNPRIGIVLGPNGGALDKMLPLFKLGLGGPLGSGAQYMPWIHRHDLVKLLVTALEDEGLDGPVNAVGPNPATNRELTRTLGRVLHRPAVLRVPKVGLRIAFGEGADMLVASQRALPTRAQARGFEYTYPDLEPALRDVTAAEPAGRQRPAEELR